MSDIKKILIVEDDVNLINMLKEHISIVTKHKLYIALTGEEALKILEAEKPDALLLDMQLPGIKGIEILQIIREKYPKTKVLVITSYDSEVKNISGELGVDGFFPKPLIVNDVVSRLEEVLISGEDTIVTPISLDDVKRRSDIAPKATILFIEKEFCMPYLLPISHGHQYPPPAIEPYGEYEYEAVYSQDDAMSALRKFKPDIVISATNVPKKEIFANKSTSTADLIAKIMQSRYAPKAVIIHGTQQSINSHKITDKSGVWIEDDDMYNYDEEKDKENVERFNKMLWSVCFKHNLVKEVK